MNIRCMNLIGPLCLLLVGCISGCGETVAAKSDAQTPLRRVTISVEGSAREAFFGQLKTFADRHAFAIRIAPVRPDGEHFIVQMWREDLKAVGTNPFDPEAFTIYFYGNDVHPVPEEHLDILIRDIKHLVGQVKGVSFPPPAKNAY